MSNPETAPQELSQNEAAVQLQRSTSPRPGLYGSTGEPQLRSRSESSHPGTLQSTIPGVKPKVMKVVCLGQPSLQASGPG